MSCLAVASVLACLLSPQNLSLEATAASKVAGHYRTVIDGHTMENAVWGRFALKMTPQLTENLSLLYGVEHISVVNNTDRGEERVFAGFVWKPFRK